jgi:hypothetical protein
VLTGKGYSPSEFPGNCILPVTSGGSLLLDYRNILHADYSGVKIVDKLRPLIVNFVHFMAKHYRHQDTEAQKGLLTNSGPSCFCAFVAIFPARPG